jgi:hypothetical protein
MTCPNCGQEFEGGHCPNCGRPASKLGKRVVAILLLVIFAIPFSCTGACFVIAGASSIGSDTSLNWSDVAIGLGATALIIGVGIGAFYLAQRLWND